MSHHILLVEDDLSIQEMVEKYLVKEGFQVTIASDGEEGVDTYLKGSFDYPRHYDAKARWLRGCTYYS